MMPLHPDSLLTRKRSTNSVVSTLAHHLAIPFLPARSTSPRPRPHQVQLQTPASAPHSSPKVASPATPFTSLAPQISSLVQLLDSSLKTVVSPSILSHFTTNTNPSRTAASPSSLPMQTTSKNATFPVELLQKRVSRAANSRCLA